MDDALRIYQERLVKLRAEYQAGLEQLEQDMADEINARIDRLGPTVSQLPAFQRIIERWVEFDPTTRLGRLHHERTTALYEVYLHDSRALARELGLCDRA